MHLHWIVVVVLLFVTFVANIYFNHDEESGLRAFVFYFFLLITFIASGVYLYRVLALLPQWNWLELVGFGISAVVFSVTSLTYRLMWKSRSKT